MSHRRQRPRGVSYAGQVVTAQCSAEAVVQLMDNRDGALVTEPRHGDPYDYPDIPGDSGLSDEYREAVMSPAVKAAIIKRRAAKFPSEAVAGRAGWVLIENEGALFTGFSLEFPQEVWSPLWGWKPYAAAGEMKPVEWGSVIGEAEALALMHERAFPG